MTHSRPSYKRRPIGSVPALARALGIAIADLRGIIDRSDNLYRLVCRKKKKQGGYRDIYEALEPLKCTQKRIHTRILSVVEYPDYLMGGIKDPERKRGCIRNATQHAGAATLIAEDISDFFPSVSTPQVQRVFQHLFHFPPDVAGALARLSTRRGQLPQGASTSTGLANLVLFQREPGVVEQLSRKGLTYSRFVDDVNVSSIMPIGADDTANVVGIVRRMMERSGFSPKRAKQEVMHAGHRMQVHGLNVNVRASVPLVERSRVRAVVFQLEQRLRSGERSDEFMKELDRATSYAARARSLHPREGQMLMTRVRAVRGGLRKARVG